MSSFLGNLWSGFGSWWGAGSMAVPDPHPPVKDDAPVTAEAPLDRSQALSVVTAMGHLAGFDAAPPPSDFVRWQMRRFHTIELAHAVVVRPILAGKPTIAIKDDRGNAGLAEKIKADAETTFLPRVMDWFPGALEHLHFGRWLQEVVWDVVDGSLIPVQFNPLLPGDYIPYKDPGGRFSGYQYRQEYRDRRYGLLTVNEEHIDPIFGWSRNDNCREEWWRIRQSEVNADRTERKASGIQMGIGAPTGRSAIDDKGGQIMAMNDAQTIVDAAQRGQSFVYPLMFFSKDTIEKTPELAKIPAMQITPFDWGDSSPAVISHLARKAALEVAIMRAWCRPEREAMAGKAGGGTNAESETQGEIGTTDSELVGQSVMRQFSRQVLNAWAVNKYGPQAADVVAMEMSPLSDPQQKFLQAFTQAAMQDTITGPELLANVDQRPLLERVEIPMVSEEDAKKKLAQQKVDKAANAPQVQPGQPMNGDGANGVPPVNGNGKANGKVPFGKAAKRLIQRMG